MNLRYAVFCCLIIMVAFTGCVQQQTDVNIDVPQPPPKPGTVALRLRSIEPVALTPGWVLRCQVTIQNETGAELRVKSHRGPSFDSMDIVVMDRGGNELLRRSCSFHSSLY